MKTRMKVGIVLLLAGVLIFALAMPSFAADSKDKAKDQEKTNFTTKEKDPVTRTAEYPGRLVEETVEVVGKTAKTTTDIAVDAVTATGQTLTGGDKTSK